MNASAVSDAQRNAEINGIQNCRFVCAKVILMSNVNSSFFVRVEVTIRFHDTPLSCCNNQMIIEVYGLYLQN